MGWYAKFTRLAFVTSIVLVSFALSGFTGASPSIAAGATGTQQVLLVGNNWDGTVDIVNPKTFKKLGRINVAPDYESCVQGPSPEQGVPCVVNNELAAEGHPQLVDDMRVSPDGGVLYVSRPSMGDVAAFDLLSREILWRVHVSGFRSDHLALSPDGSELIASATTAKVADVIDTQQGAIVDQIPTGDFPHENEYSEDGQLIYNGSIGRVVTPDNEELDAAKGDRWFTIADAQTHEVKKVIDFGVGVRPFIVMPDNRLMYVQLSFLHGFVEYDLQEERTLRTVQLPLRGAQEGDNELDSAHHGLAMNGDRTKICDAGTVADYVAIVWRESLEVDRIIPIDTSRRGLSDPTPGDKPYWATSSADGRYCFVANSSSDNVSVISYDKAKEIERFRVGDHPQRMRMAGILSEALATL
jgi:DNA-binding beta-propeller fold protein YncE